MFSEKAVKHIKYLAFPFHNTFKIAELTLSKKRASGASEEIFFQA